MRFISYLLPQAPWVLTYMLQQVEYDSNAFLRWVAKLPALHTLMKRQTLVRTARTLLLLGVAYGMWVLLLCGFIVLVLMGSFYALILLLMMPVAVSLTLWLVNGLLGILVIRPIEKKHINHARQQLTHYSAVKIAVLGSYGKTTMKELLATILSEGLQVKATPGNKNVLISHARWVLNEVSGEEDVLIFEYGEYKPGDIKRLAGLSQPEWAVITGLTAAHLQNYSSLDGIADDFQSIFSGRNAARILVNGDSPELISRITDGQTYNRQGVLGWSITDMKNSLDGIRFTMKKDDVRLNIKSPIVGEHMIGPLAASIAIGHELGLSVTQLETGAANTQPFEHRMQPYKLGPATVIDDTYNGNLEGMKAGLKLLASLEAKRKVYVTPGLVEQGNLTQSIHRELGRCIAAAKPDKVVLMKNSVTDHIKTGLRQHQFAGEVQIEENPLEFYTNLEHYVAAGDVLLLQNDWPDAYS